MLFLSQRHELLGNDGKLYFVGTAIIPDTNPNKVALVTGVKQSKAPDKVIVNVEYLDKSGTTTQAFNRVLSPADFERFINKFAMKVGAESKGKHKLYEISDRPVIDDEQVPLLNETKKVGVLHYYLTAVCNGFSSKNSIIKAKDLIMKHKQLA